MSFEEKLIALWSILRKEIVRFLRIWPQTLLPPVVNQSLYFIIFGAFIGAQVGPIHGVSYMSFILPGLVMMAVINNAFANVAGSFFGAKFLRNVEELMVSPSPPWVVLGGFVLGGTLRGITVGALVFLVSLFFTPPVLHNLFLVLIFVILTALVFSLSGFLNALFAKTFDDVSIIPTFVLMPLTYFGGVFYSIESLPDFFQTLSKFNPILYMIDGFRYGFFGWADVDVRFSLLMLGLLTVFLFVLNLYFLKKGSGLKA